ncbi:phospholipase D-like domain-containing protein [Wolbachia pipientis]|uniref:hypothetical protein n=1 Tax=Wolbachia pipientis TaxID=955 RepID=UPI00202F2E72|nr:hypothetical protein [Wolbachia pipientis]
MLRLFAQTSSKHSVITELLEYKIPVWIDFKPAIAHSDVAQQRNAENLLIITRDSPLVEQYLKNWKDRQSQSKLYTPE